MKRLSATATVFDERGLVYTVQDAALRLTRFDVHPNGRLQAITDPALRVTLYDYDGHDRLSKITHDELAKTELFSYDDNGNLDLFTTRNANQIDYEYEDWNRLRTKDTVAVLPGVQAKKTTYTYLAGGQIDTVSLAAGATTEVALDFVYNAINQLTHQKVTALDGFLGSLPLTLTTPPDGEGNVGGMPRAWDVGRGRHEAVSAPRGRPPRSSLPPPQRKSPSLLALA